MSRPGPAEDSQERAGQIATGGSSMDHSTFSDTSERAVLVGWEWTPLDL